MTDSTSPVACYLRVSTEMQADKNGTDAQRHAIERWCLANGIEAPRWFEDAGVSGKTMQRAQWRAMMEGVKAGTITTIVLYDLSRAGRNLRDLCQWIEEMGERKVRVVFVAEGIDLATITGQLLAHVLGAVAEFIRKQTIEKIRSGVRAKLAKGEAWGSARSTLTVNKNGGRHGIPILPPDKWREVADAYAVSRDQGDEKARALGVKPKYARAKARRLNVAV